MAKPAVSRPASRACVCLVGVPAGVDEVRRRGRSRRRRRARSAANCSGSGTGMLHRPGRTRSTGGKGMVAALTSAASGVDRSWRASPRSLGPISRQNPYVMARDHAAAQWSGCGVPPHGDRPQLRPRLQPLDLRAAGRPRLRALPRVLRAAREPAPPHRAVPAASRRGALRPRPPVLDRRSRIRPRLPHPAPRAAVAGQRRAAHRAGGPHHQPPARPQPPAVGGLRHRGLGGRRLRHPHEDPPRHRRRRLGRGAAHDHARRRSRRHQGRAAGDAMGARQRAVVVRAAPPGRRQPHAQPGSGQPHEPAGDERGGQGPAAARRRRRCARRPAPPPPAGGAERRGRAAGPAAADATRPRSAHAVQQGDHVAPPLRHRLGAPRPGEGDQEPRSG